MVAKFLSLVTLFALCTISAAAQVYGGGGGTGGGTPGSTTPTYTNRSYSNKGAIIGGVAGGAALAGGLLLWHAHKRATMVGCVGPNASTLVNEKNKQTYSITADKGVDLKPGERVKVSGKKIGKNDNLALQVDHLRKDYGSCQQQALLAH
jgi:hypothetical protein